MVDKLNHLKVILTTLFYSVRWIR